MAKLLAMPQYVKLPNGKTFVRYDYRTDGAYWLRVGRKPWWNVWLKLAVAAGLIVIFWPLIHLLLLLLWMGVLLACLSVFLIPLNAFLGAGSGNRCRRRRSQWR